MKVLVVHGPNLDQLGKREPHIYGKDTLEDINTEICSFCERHGATVVIHQYNGEGEIISCIADSDADVLVINPAAYTHTSLAIVDSVRSFNKPTVEVHLSNIYKRETIRHHSLLSPYVVGQLSGFGKKGYLLALAYVLDVSL